MLLCLMGFKQQCCFYAQQMVISMDKMMRPMDFKQAVCGD